MIVPPFCDGLGWRELLAHYAAVADRIAVKTACALVGDPTGPVRAPLLPLDDVATAELRHHLAAVTQRESQPFGW